MAEQWIDIDKEAPLLPGDRIRLNYKTVGLTYATAAQIALVENKLEGEKRFRVISHSYPEGEGWTQSFWFEILIVDPAGESAAPEQIQQAGIITAGIVSTIVLGAMGFVIWVTFDGVTKAIEAAGGLGWTSVQIAAALIAVYLVYKYA